MNKSNIILVGPPGAGKGTQAILLRDKMDLNYISTGDLFRFNLNNSTTLGKKAQQYMSTGELVPDSITINMLAEELNSLGIDKGFILDGFPRTLPQAESLDAFMENLSIELDTVLFFDVPNDELVLRLSSRYTCRECQAPNMLNSSKTSEVPTCSQCNGELYQREDDTPSAIERRLEVYDQETKPIINFYETKGILHTIDSLGKVEEVFSKVMEVV
jgi:adenylate kinase